MQTLLSLHDAVTETYRVDSTGYKLEHCLKQTDACIQWRNKINTEDTKGDSGCTKKGGSVHGSRGERSRVSKWHHVPTQR